MMRSLGNIAFLVLALTALSGCGAPYGDDEFREAIADIDNVTGSSGGCNTVDLAWQCDTTVDMSPDASAGDIAKAIKATGGLLRDNGRDSSRIRVSDNESTPLRGAILEFSKPVKGSGDVAAAMQVAATDDAVEFARFDQRSEGIGISLTTNDDLLAPLARTGEELLTLSKADSILAITRNSHFRIDAREGAWPATEVAILTEVSARYTVEKARAGKDFLSIAGTMGDMDEAEAFAEGRPGIDTIGFVDISNDVRSDLANALGTDLRAVGAMADELRRLDGFSGLIAGEKQLTIRADSIDAIAAMDRDLTTKFGTAYAGMGVTYAIEKRLELARAAGQDLWLRTAKSLDDSGLVASLRIGKNEPRGATRAITVLGNQGVGLRELAAAVARAWEPGQAARVQIEFRTAEGRDTIWFTAAETITFDERSQFPASQTDLVDAGWAEGRSAG